MKDNHDKEIESVRKEYEEALASVKMHQAMVKTAINTIQESKEEMTKLALKLEACKTRLQELTNQEEDLNE